MDALPAAADPQLARLRLAEAREGHQARASRLSPTEAERVALEFESLVIAQFVSAMSEGLSTEGPFGGGHAEAVFRSLLHEEYAKAMVAQGGLGLADAVRAELLRQQEAAS